VGWILFLEEDGRGKPTPHAWPAAQTRITIQGDGFRLSSGGGGGSAQAVIDTDDIEHTNDFQQVVMWLRPDDEDQGEGDGEE